MTLNQSIKIFFLVLTWHVVLISSATCQVGFNKVVTIPGALNWDFDDILISKNEIVLRGNAYIDSLGLWGLNISKLDTNGVVLSTNTIVDSVHQRQIISTSPCRFIISDRNQYIIPSYYYDDNKVALFVADSLGNELFTNEYIHSGKPIFPKDVIQIDNSNFIFGTVQRDNLLRDIFIIKTDSIGIFMWIKYYGSTTLNEEFSDVQQNENGKLTISASIFTSNYSAEDINVGWVRPWIFSVDTSGTIIKEWKGDQNDVRAHGAGPFYVMDNEDVVIVAFERKEVLVSGGNYVFTAPTITRLDSNFQLIWKDSLAYFTGFWDKLIDLEYDAVRDEFVAAGHRVVSYYPWYSELEAWAVKFKPDGEVIWSVSDTVYSDSINGVIHFTSGLAIAPSGSIYLTGYVKHYISPSRTYGWIIKVTPDGCMDTLCTTTSIENQLHPKKIVNVTVAPNPAVDQIHISIKDLRGDARLEMYDPGGRRVLISTVYEGENAIPIDLPQGLYFYSIYNSAGIVGSGKIVMR